MDWIEDAYNHPDYEQIQADDRIRRWRFIKEADKYLCIIALEDGETIHKAFFDRDFKLF